MTNDNKEEQHRFTFSCMITEADRIETRIRAECFERGIRVDNLDALGGFIKERTYGVLLEGPKKQVQDFQKWWEEHNKDLCDTRSLFGAFIRDHL